MPDALAAVVVLILMSLKSLLHGVLNCTAAEVAAAAVAADAAATVEGGTLQHPQMPDAPAAVVVV